MSGADLARRNEVTKAIVTGGGQGIGFAIARRLVEEGCRKLVLVGRSEDKGGKAVAVLSASGADVRFVSADLGKVASKPVPSAAVLEDRGTSVSRSLTRRQAVKARTGKTQWTTVALDLWKRPGKHADKAGEVKEGVKVLATGRTLNGRVEIVVE